MDLDALDAIDVPVHVEQDSHGCFALDQELLDASAKYFRADQDRTPTLASIAEHYRARRTAAVVFTVDAPAGAGPAPARARGRRARGAPPPATRTPCGHSPGTPRTTPPSRPPPPRPPGQK